MTDGKRRAFHEWAVGGEARRLVDAAYAFDEFLELGRQRGG